jgi:hypothetical protein
VVEADEEEKDRRLNGRWGGISVNGEGKGGLEYRYLKMDEYVRKGGGS